MKFKNQYLYCNIRNKIAFNIIMESKISDGFIILYKFWKGCVIYISFTILMFGLISPFYVYSKLFYFWSLIEYSYDWNYYKIDNINFMNVFKFLVVRIFIKKTIVRLFW